MKKERKLLLAHASGVHAKAAPEAGFETGRRLVRCQATLVIGSLGSNHVMYSQSSHTQPDSDPDSYLRLSFFIWRV